MAEKEFIEREALIQHMQECKGDSSFNIMATGYAYAFIKQAPAADVVEVRHGEWLDAQYTYFGAKRYECSLCRDDEFWKRRYIEIKENYCPNCGAKMDGEKK